MVYLNRFQSLMQLEKERCKRMRKAKKKQICRRIVSSSNQIMPMADKGYMETNLTLTAVPVGIKPSGLLINIPQLSSCAYNLQSHGLCFHINHSIGLDVAFMPPDHNIMA